MPCTTTHPGHATNLTGVKVALALRDDPHRTPVPATVTAAAAGRIALDLPGGTLEARCHDADRLGALLAAARAAGRPAPAALFTAHEHQLLVEVDPADVAAGGTVFLAGSSGLGAIAGFNLALPWHATVPCAGEVPPCSA